MAGSTPQLAIRIAANTAELKANLAEGKASIEALGPSVAKLAATWAANSNTIIQNARNIVAAVDQVGTSTMTAGDAARGLKTLEAAMAQLRAAGEPIPPLMQATAEQLRAVENAANPAAKAGGMVASVFGQVFAAFSAASLASQAVSTLTDLGHAAIEGARSVMQLSDKTGLSTTTIQQMQYVAKQTDSDMQSFANAAFKMGVNVADGTAKARKGAEELGLDWAALRAASPDEQFNMVVSALERMEDPQKRNAAAVALFGKTAKDIMPAVVAGYSKIAEAATLSSDAQLKAVDRASKAWDAFYQRQVTNVTSWLGNAVIARDTISKLTDEQMAAYQALLRGGGDAQKFLLDIAASLAKQVDIKLPSMAAPALPPSFVQALGAAKEGYRNLTTEQRANLNAAFELGTSNEAIINDLNITDGVLSIAKKAYEDHKRAVSEAAAEQKRFAEANANAASSMNDLSGEQVEAIKYYLQQKFNIDEISKIMEVYKHQVEEVQQTENLRTLMAVSNYKILAGAIKYYDDLVKAEHETENAAFLAGGSAITAAGAKMYDELDKQTMTSTDYQVTKIGEWAQAQMVAFKGTADQRVIFDAIIKASADNQVNDLYIDNKALRDNTVESLQQTADRASNTYLEMADHPEKYKASTIAKFKAISDAARREADGTAEAWNRAFTVLDGASQILGTIGGKFGELGQIGITAFEGISKSLAKGDIFGAVVAGVTGAIKAIKALFGGPSADELAGRKVEATFEQSFGGFDQMSAAIGAAYAATGRSASQANADILALMAAEKQGAAATQAALDKINVAFDDQKQKITDTKTAVDAVVSAYQGYSGKIPDSVKATINSLLTMKGLTDDEKTALEGLMKTAAPDYASLTSMAAGYGITLAGLGPKFQQANIDSSAKKIFDDFTALTDAGGDVGGILFGMSGSITKLVSDSKNFGTAIPDNMKPLIQNLIDSGKLLDDNGKAITDITGIKFEATPLDTGLKTLNDTLQKLIDTLTGKGGLVGGLNDVANGLNGLPSSKVITITEQMKRDFTDMGASTDWTQGGIGDAHPIARGGLVTDRGVRYLAGGGPARGNLLRFMPRGTDTIPAMLTKDEGVVNTTGMGILGVDGLARLNHGQAPASATGGSATAMFSMSFGDINVSGDASGSDVADAVERRFDDVIIPKFMDKLRRDGGFRREIVARLGVKAA